MDVRILQAGAEGLCGIQADLMLLLLPSRRDAWAEVQGCTELLDEAVAGGDLVLKPGRTLYLHRPSCMKAVRCVIGVAGDEAHPTSRDAVRAVVAAVSAVKQQSFGRVVLAWGGQADLTEEAAQAAVVAIQSALYSYRLTKPSAAALVEWKELAVLGSKSKTTGLRAAVRRALAVAAGVNLARDCANRPGNHFTPTLLAEEARHLAREFGFKVEVLDRKAVEKLGMGAFLAVAKGSDEPLQFIGMHYQGAAKKVAPRFLVGKGITFDSGGISLKPAAEMDEMKFDMGGAASVLGVFRAIGELRPKINLVGLIPACENLPSGRATKPGDVVTSLSGQTIEVLNTDAEGRLILCDALTYAERFKPAAVVDIATLTGACVIALGHQRAGLFSPDDPLATALQAAGDRALDPVWRLPLDDEYDEALKSNFADMANVGSRAGGVVTAAMFLKRYTKAYRWAHLDIAGVAWKSGAAKGATGRPVALLTEWLLTEAD